MMEGDLNGLMTIAECLTQHNDAMKAILRRDISSSTHLNMISDKRVLTALALHIKWKPLHWKPQPSTLRSRLADWQGRLKLAWRALRGDDLQEPDYD